MRLILGDCVEVMRGLAAAGTVVQSIVTDPPYGLTSVVRRFGKEGSAPAKSDGATGVYRRASAGFMGQQWDGSGVETDPATWRACYDLLPPGGHLLAFGGTRTWHRIAAAIEDAGFEIRDTIMWVYGTGFPKSHDVSKGIDKALGVEFEASPAGGVGFMGPDGPGGYNPTKNKLTRTGETTIEAAPWQGWGTALKPAVEPIIVARKPLVGTVAANVLAHGTGAINIDGCRVGDEVRVAAYTLLAPCHGNALGAAGTAEARRGTQGDPKTYTGRWPANLVHDGSDEVEAAFAAFGDRLGQQGRLTGDEPSATTKSAYGKFRERALTEIRGDVGSASRFFYGAKATKADREDGNRHPTVKPTDLMRWLVRLVTPPGGTVLDPFMGSGSTGKAAAAEGLGFIGIEQSPDYLTIAKARVPGAVLSLPDIMTLAAHGRGRLTEALRAARG